MDDEDIVFRRHDIIGCAAAEEDDAFLNTCFVDTGDLQSILEFSDPKRIVVGRTGAGKTALLTKAANSNYEVIEISPHGLSLNYIANNSVINFFETSGLNLAAYYTLLWKHLLVVELLKKRYQITNESDAKTVMTNIRGMITRDRSKEMAIDYLEKWGNKFWLTSETRMKELTERIEKELGATIEGKFKFLDISMQGAKNLTTEQKSEVVELGRKAVSGVQVRELNNLIDILNDTVFINKQQRFLVTVDSLDENWADDRIRYKLIKALIDAIRQFKKVDKVKIILSMRVDLLVEVLQSTKDPGFQQEKYASLYLYVKWSRSQLKELIGKRVNQLLKSRYTNHDVELSKIFSSKVNGKIDPIDYIIDRTFMRPRDVIEFVNACISSSENESKVTSTAIKNAEEEYSTGRLIALASEWRGVYPNLKQVVETLYGVPEAFPLSDLTEVKLAELYENAVDEITDTSSDEITRNLDKLYENDGNFGTIRSRFVRQLYQVGIFGIRFSSSSTTQWNYEAKSALQPTPLNLSGNTRITVHPMFHRVLGIRTSS